MPTFLRTSSFPPRNNCITYSARILEKYGTSENASARNREDAYECIKIPRYDKAVRDFYLTVSWGLLDLNVGVEGPEGDGNGMLSILVTYYHVW